MLIYMEMFSIFVFLIIRYEKYRIKEQESCQTIQRTVPNLGNSFESSSYNQALLKHNVHVVALKSNRCFLRAHILACHMRFWCVI